MAKIVSRNTTEGAVVQQLQDTLVNHSMGAITAKTGGVAQVGSDMPALVNQVDAVLQSLVQTLEHAAVDLSVARTEAAQYSMKVDELESIVENLLGDVSFDEALDEATLNLMEGLSSSGSADVSADGELTFDERITFSKEDLKPYLQRAITVWIEQRLSL